MINLQETATGPVCPTCQFVQTLTCTECYKSLCWTCNGVRTGIWLTHTGKCMSELRARRQVGWGRPGWLVN